MIVIIIIINIVKHAVRILEVRIARSRRTGCRDAATSGHVSLIVGIFMTVANTTHRCTDTNTHTCGLFIHSHSTSIYAAKLVDPTPLGDPYAEAVREQRIQDTPMTAVVHADVNKVGHALGSHAAARYYLQENKKHRDEVLAQAAAEE